MLIIISNLRVQVFLLNNPLLSTFKTNYIFNYIQSQWRIWAARSPSLNTEKNFKA